MLKPSWSGRGCHCASEGRGGGPPSGSGSAVRPAPGLRPVPHPPGPRPRLLAGGRGRPRVARRLRRPRGRRHGPLAIPTSCARSPSRPRRCSSTRPPFPIRSASGWRSGWRRSVPIRWAGSSSATRARRPTRTRCTSPGSGPAASRIVSVAGGWHGRTVATLACTDGARYEEARGARAASRSRARCRPTTSPRSTPRWTTGRRGDPGAGAGPLRGARDLSAEFLRAARAGL